ncbi:MAG: translation initiation factor [Silvanigrellales bacterium]|nr:translation initiation factor [Silvanigrellales bacterium]
MSDQAPDAKKKKPIRLEWQGGLLSASAPNKEAENEDAQKGPAVAWKGALKIRREVKGRGGKPVALLHEFTPGASGAQKALLCKLLKERLGCGGTVDDGNVLVQVDDFARLAKALEALGVRASRGGGFS